jgi:hypothetical protein
MDRYRLIIKYNQNGIDGQNFRNATDNIGFLVTGRDA